MKWRFILSSHFTLSRQSLHEIDQRAVREFNVPSIILMENAGRTIADILMSYAGQGLVVICCGKGNNAGDGFVVARTLDNHHIPVRVLLFSDPNELAGDAKINYDILTYSDIGIRVFNQDEIETTLPTELSQAEWLVDALLGTGLKGQVRAPFERIIELMNQAGKKIMSVDIPSGLDCDTGEALGSVIKAYCTVTLVAAKTGFNTANAEEFIGKLYVSEIGIPIKLIEQYRQDLQHG